MPGILYIVGTPIGNLQDLSRRSADILAAVDFIAAEDTRVTVKLLNHLGLKKPLISYHEHNERVRCEGILNRLENGESCALCSDAGLPAISDPGQILVQEAKEKGITVVPIPGPNAALTALCASGQDSTRFVFEGFLPQNRNARAQRLSHLQDEERTMLFYEAPHKLVKTLQDLQAVFGPTRGISLCRELTKLHEEIVKTTLDQAILLYTQEKPRGEFVLVVAGSQEKVPAALPPLQEVAAGALHLPLSLSAAAKQAASESGHSKSAVYKEMLRQKNEPNSNSDM